MPLAILLVVPLGVLGVVLGAHLRGLENDVYFKVGMITIIGLSAKNAVLIVETAAQIRRLERVGDWNSYEIRCDGPRVEILLNGERTLVFTEDDPAVSADGLIALQIHGGCKAEISFRAIMIEER